MRTILCFVIATALVLGSFAALPIKVSAANLDTSADRVFGQPGFTSNTTNNGGVSATSLFSPNGMALDAQGNLYVADTFNHRVLEYDAPLTTSAAADRVFGQPDFSSNTLNNGGVNAHSLYFPGGVALDVQGNLYVADQGNNRVLEYDTPLTADSTADRVFGQPNFSSNTSNNGGISADSLNSPYGVALDAAGNLYVADTFNYRVLEYDTPLSQDASADRVFGQPGFTSNTTNNGGVSANSLNIPFNVTLDPQDNLYVADYGNSRVLEYDLPLTTDSTADRVFGQPGFTSNTPNNGGLSANSLNLPSGTALDAQGDLYVVDSTNQRVLEYTAPLSSGMAANRVFGQGGSFTTALPNNGSLGASSLNNPIGVTLDAHNNLYLADQGNNRVLEYDEPLLNGIPLLSALSPSTVAAGVPAFTLTVNGSDFVVGSNVRWNGSNRPTTFLSRTQLNASITAADVVNGGPFAVTVFTPIPGGGASAPISLPLYLRNGQDTTADGVQGQPNFLTGLLNNTLLPGGANRLRHPGGVAIDQPSGRLFVADSGNQRVLSWPNAPAFANGQAADLVLGQPNFASTLANNGGLSAHSLFLPSGVAVDAQGNLYVADTQNNRVLEYDAPLTTGASADRVFGQPDFTSNAANNGGVSTISLFAPFNVALDVAGNLYVADYGNNRVLEFDTPLFHDASADRVFGQPNFTSNTLNNGGVSASSLKIPYGIVLDIHGNLYVADDGNHRVLEYDTPLTADTTADRVFGQPDTSSNTSNNGGLSANSLQFPTEVALDAQEDLYVADNGNNRVLEYDTPLSSGVTADRVFGQPDFSSNPINNGGVSANSLNFPVGVTLDAAGNLYVADQFNNRVLEYDVPVSYGAPALSALSPSTMAAGSQAFTLTVNGSGFVLGSTVRWNSSDRLTTFLSTTQLNASIAATDVASGGPFAVTVFTPAPGGGVSALINLSLYLRNGQDTVADGVLGQPNFLASFPNNSLLPGGANRLNIPNSVEIDQHSGRLFVVDTGNHRVLSWQNAPAFTNGQAADLVIGQLNIASIVANNGGVSAHSLKSPSNVALDAQGNLYVADSGNNRVLEFTAPLTNGMAANRVFGQGGSFTTALLNNGGVSANSLNAPTGVALDVAGNLYVADSGNHRVLEYDTPLSAGAAADLVFGQPDFTANTLNNGGVSANSLHAPYGVALDAQGDLFVADLANHRVLEYNTPKTAGATADRVFGQPDFTSNAANNGGFNARSLADPYDMALDVQGNLYVVDNGNNRVLEYKTPLTTGAAANRVFGQPDFISGNGNTGGLSAHSLNVPSGLALDARGNLYVADSQNNRLLEYDSPSVKVLLPLIMR